MRTPNLQILDYFNVILETGPSPLPLLDLLKQNTMQLDMQVLL